MGEVAAALEEDPSAGQSGVVGEPFAETGLVARVDEIDGAAEGGVFDPLVHRHVRIDEIVPFRRRFELRPTGKAVLAGDRELGVGQREFRLRDPGLAGPEQAGMELADALVRFGIGGALGLLKVAGLVAEVVEAGVGGNRFERHGTNSLSSVRLLVRMSG